MNFLGYFNTNFKCNKPKENHKQNREIVQYANITYNKVLIQELKPTKFLGQHQPHYAKHTLRDLYFRDIYKSSAEQNNMSFSCDIPDDMSDDKYDEYYEEQYDLYEKKSKNIGNKNKSLFAKLNKDLNRFIYFKEETQRLSDKTRIDNTNSFLGAFLDAYNYHGDIVLSPDDIWIAITLFISNYIDNNAEFLRNKFVKHSGKMALTVIENENYSENTIALEKKWDYFFDAICLQIKENTIEGVVEDLICNFSTTKPVHERISTAIIMNSFKKYFDYGRMICGCGIGNVYFEGTSDDWIKLKSKLLNLQKYFADMEDGKIQEYIKRVEIILDNFIQTYDGKPDINFWNTIASTRSIQIGSGGETATYVKGWILHFLGIYTEEDIDIIPDFTINVPVTLENTITSQTKNLQILAKFVSSSVVIDSNCCAIYKPDIGICIFHPEEEF